jgi:hypothetical protein
MKPERELHGLHTIKRIVVELEHPSGCLHEILTTLYDNFALSKDGFLMWRDDTDPLEQEGKGEKVNETQMIMMMERENPNFQKGFKCKSKLKVLFPRKIKKKKAINYV